MDAIKSFASTGPFSSDVLANEKLNDLCTLFDSIASSEDNVFEDILLFVKSLTADKSLVATVHQRQRIYQILIASLSKSNFTNSPLLIDIIKKLIELEKNEQNLVFLLVLGTNLFEITPSQVTRDTLITILMPIIKSLLLSKENFYSIKAVRALSVFLQRDASVKEKIVNALMDMKVSIAPSRLKVTEILKVSLSFQIPKVKKCSNGLDILKRIVSESSCFSFESALLLRVLNNDKFKVRPCDIAIFLEAMVRFKVYKFELEGISTETKQFKLLLPKTSFILSKFSGHIERFLYQQFRFIVNCPYSQVVNLLFPVANLVKYDNNEDSVRGFFEVMLCFSDDGNFLGMLGKFGYLSKFKSLLKILISSVTLDESSNRQLIILLCHPFITETRYSPSSSLLTRLLNEKSKFTEYIESASVLTDFERFICDDLAVFKKNTFGSYFLEATFVAFSFLSTYVSSDINSSALVAAEELLGSKENQVKECFGAIDGVRKKINDLCQPQFEEIKATVTDTDDEDKIYENIKLQQKLREERSLKQQETDVEVAKLETELVELRSTLEQELKEIRPAITFFLCFFRSVNLEARIDFTMVSSFFRFLMSSPELLGEKSKAVEDIEIVVNGQASLYMICQRSLTSSISDRIWMGFHDLSIDGNLIFDMIDHLSPLLAIFLFPYIANSVQDVVLGLEKDLELPEEEQDEGLFAKAAFIPKFCSLVKTLSSHVSNVHELHFSLVSLCLIGSKHFKDEFMEVTASVFAHVTELKDKVRKLVFSEEGLLSTSLEKQNICLTLITKCIQNGVVLSEEEKAIVFILSNREQGTNDVKAILSSIKFEVNEEIFPILKTYLAHQNNTIKNLVGKSYATIPLTLKKSCISVWQDFIKEYIEKSKHYLEKKQSYDLLDSVLKDSQKGKKLKAQLEENTSFRYGVSLVLREVFSRKVFDISITEQSSFLERYFSFLLENGVTDSNLKVRNAFLQSGINIVENYGETIASTIVQLLTPLLEGYKVSSLEVSKVQEKKKSSEEKKKKKSKVISLSAAPVKKAKKTKVKKKKTKESKKKMGTDVIENVGSPTEWKSQAAVIFLGGLVPYFGKDKTLKGLIPKVFKLLIKSLVSYEENVQKSASQCLGKIISISDDIDIGSEVSSLTEKLYDNLPSDLSLIKPMKQGIALGIASIIGTSSIEVYCEAIDTLLEEMKENMDEEKQPAKRIVSLLLLDALNSSRGILFEPYLFDMIPSILLCFGDGKRLVRDETKRLSKSIMKKISVVGLKMILPLVIKGFSGEADSTGQSWRIKEASIRLLGSVAYLDEQILADFLPVIVPKLMSCFVDSQIKIQSVARKAMAEISGVVQNAELRSMSKIILKALIEPETYIDTVMSALTKLSLSSDIDAAALAILIPILKRGLKDKKSETKINAAIVIGRVSAKVRSNVSLLSTLIELLPLIKPVLADPIPTARSTAAKTLRNLALGSLSKEEFEDVISSYSYDQQTSVDSNERTTQLLDLLNYLLTALFTGQSSVERSGGANGLVEILTNLESIDMLSKFLAVNIMSRKNSKKPEEREGVLWTFVFLPISFGPIKNKPLLSFEFKTILSGFEDETDSIRNVGVRAGKSLIHLHVQNDSTKLIAELMNALSSSKWRVKVASLHLLNDLLYLLGKNQSDPERKYNYGNETEGFNEINISNDDDEEESSSEDESDDEGTPQVSQALLSKDTVLIAKAVGSKQRNIIFSKLFILRSDTNISVRNSAIKVWKNYVFQTGKLVKIMLGDLLKSITIELTSTDIEKKSMASSALGELVTKHAERVLPRVIPFLETKVFSNNEESAYEAIVCLVEVVRYIAEEQAELYFSSISRMIQEGLLIGENEDLRKFAAISFDLLYKKASELTVKKMIPKMLEKLERSEQGSEENQNILTALQLMIEKRSNQILPFLIPKLLSKKATKFEIRALRDICKVSGPPLQVHYRSIISTLFNRLSVSEDHTDELQVLEQISCNASEAHLSKLIEVLLDCVTPKKIQGTSVGLLLVNTFLNSLDLELETEQSLLIAKSVFQLYTLSDTSGVVRLQDTSLALFNRQDIKESLLENIDVLRGSIKTVVSKIKFSRKNVNDRITLQVFESEKLVTAFSDLYKQILTSPNADHNKEFAALGIGDLVVVSPEAVFNPRALIKITGPLIRASSERLDGNTRVAIFTTLYQICERGDTKLKALAPQLLSSSLKNVSADNSTVRSKCLDIISLLVSLTPRVDNVFRELFKIINDKEQATEIVATAFECLNCVIAAVPGKVKPQFLNDIILQWNQVEEFEDVDILVAYSRCLGRAVQTLVKDGPNEEVEKLVSEDMVYLVEAGVSSNKEQDYLFLQALTSCAVILQCAPNLDIFQSEQNKLNQWFTTILKIAMLDEELKQQLKATKVAFYFSLLETYMKQEGKAIVKEVGSLIGIGGYIGNLCLRNLALYILRNPMNGIKVCVSLSSRLISAGKRKSSADEVKMVLQSLKAAMKNEKDIDIPAPLLAEMTNLNEGSEDSIEENGLYLFKTI